LDVLYSSKLTHGVSGIDTDRTTILQLLRAYIYLRESGACEWQKTKSTSSVGSCGCIKGLTYIQCSGMNPKTPGLQSHLALRMDISQML